MNIAKYEFTSKEQAQTKIDALNEEPNNHTIVTLGHIVLEPAVIDEDGVVITEAVLSEGWCIDAIWIGLTDHPYGWKSYDVDLLNEGLHGFAGVSYLANKF
tara:strand:- start:263 stop:565 length:303 start_codon:yes stop_codon:yes gene_type:complete